ncbi:MAG: MFS transporter [Roseiflexaceae bacterium]
MYQIQNLKDLFKSRQWQRSRRIRVSPNVLFLGLTSLFTDVSSEMISTILPLYLVFILGLAPINFGIIDGLYQGSAAIMRLASGLIADRWRRHKEVAAVGYALSAICKLGFLAAGNVWTVLAGIILVDRMGKGIRTAPRDALISLSTSQAELATAFGVHRALDTAGAMLGPLVAFGLLALAPGAFDAIFVVSFCFAMVGFGVITLFVQNQPADRDSSIASSGVSLQDVAGLLRLPRLRALVLIGTALSLATMSDGFLYLGLQRRLNFNVGFFPLLYVATALVYMLLAVPFGRLADRFGRERVFLGGYVLLLIVYTSLLLPAVIPLAILVYLVLFGAYYAATDGVLMALASTGLPPDLRTSGLALLTTATGLSRLFSSILFGLLWTWWDLRAAVSLFLVTLGGTILVAAVMLLYMKRNASQAGAARP